MRNNMNNFTPQQAFGQKEAAVPNIMAKQTRSQNMGNLLNWPSDDNNNPQKKAVPRQAWDEEQPKKSAPRQAWDEEQPVPTKYPPPKYPGQTSLTAGLEQEDDQVAFPSRMNQNQNEDEVAFPSRAKKLTQDDDEISFPSRVSKQDRRPPPARAFTAPEQDLFGFNQNQRDDAEDQISFPSRVGKQHQGGSVGPRKGFNQPSSQIQFGQGEDQNAQTKKQAMAMLQNQLQGASMQQMMVHRTQQGAPQDQGFKGSFGGKNKTSQDSRGENPRFAEAEKRVESLQNIETNMMQLNMERDKLKDELAKMPENAKKGAQIRRREFLEEETQLLSRQIGTLKQKLRDLQAI